MLELMEALKDDPEVALIIAEPDANLRAIKFTQWWLDKFEEDARSDEWRYTAPG